MTALRVRLEAYEVGYRDGWKDIHLSTRWRRKRRRQRFEEYARGYAAGRIDGASHPHCPDWLEGHRAGDLRALPRLCPWNPLTAAQTPDWSPLAEMEANVDAIAVTRSAVGRKGAILQEAAPAAGGASQVTLLKSDSMPRPAAEPPEVVSGAA